MGYLKENSTASQREQQLRKACTIITERVKEGQVQETKSYPIKSYLPTDVESNITFFQKRKFGRG